LAEASAAITELKVIADKMTSLGVDLEDQVAEQLQANLYLDCRNGYEGETLEEVMVDREILSPRALDRYHLLPRVWGVVFPELNRYIPEDDSWVLEDERVVREFYSQEEAEEAVALFEKRELELSEGYEGL